MSTSSPRVRASEVIVAVWCALCGAGPGVVVRGAEKIAPPDLFAAREQGLVGVRVVVRDRQHARVIVKNRTEGPLTIALPAVFAARPVLAQQGFFGNGSTTQAPAPQPVAGPMQFNSARGVNAGVGANQNFFQPGDNMFNIAPESVRSLPVSCFCLAHGRPDPRSSVPYELVPAEEAGVDATLTALLLRYGREQLDHEAMQAAVWHAADGKSWRELASMSRRIALNAEEPIFTGAQLRAAKTWAEAATVAARRKAEASREQGLVVEGQRLAPARAEIDRTSLGIQARRSSAGR